MIKKLLVILNVIILMMSLCFLLLGGMFQCSSSYIGKYYGSISCAISMIIMVFVYLLNISAKNNGKFPLSKFSILFPVMISILSILVNIYNTKKHKNNILLNKANTNYYYYNGLFVLSLGGIVMIQIFNLLMNFFYDTSNSLLKNILKYSIFIISIINGIFSYFSHYYINL